MVLKSLKSMGFAMSLWPLCQLQAFPNWSFKGSIIPAMWFSVHTVTRGSIIPAIWFSVHTVTRGSIIPAI